jgi:hypothetical protein
MYRSSSCIGVAFGLRPSDCRSSTPTEAFSAASTGLFKGNISDRSGPSLASAERLGAVPRSDAQVFVLRASRSIPTAAIAIRRRPLPSILRSQRYRPSGLVHTSAAGHERQCRDLEKVPLSAPAMRPTRLCPMAPKRWSCRAAAAQWAPAKPAKVCTIRFVVVHSMNPRHGVIGLTKGPALTSALALGSRLLGAAGFDRRRRAARYRVGGHQIAELGMVVAAIVDQEATMRPSQGGTIALLTA